jgi:hypothetical protein
MNWKSIPLWLLTAFLSYSCIKTPTYTDGLICLVLGSLYGLEIYLAWRSTPVKQDVELSKIRKELELEKLQFEKERITRARVTETEQNSGAGLRGMIKF